MDHGGRNLENNRFSMDCVLSGANPNDESSGINKMEKVC